MKKHLSLISFTLLFLISFAIYFFAIETPLIYANLEPLFIRVPIFRIPFYEYPGGIPDLISLFFLQYYQFPVLGAIIASCLLLIIGMLFSILIQKTTSISKSSPFLIFPPLIILMFQFNYDAISSIMINWIIILSAILLGIVIDKKLNKWSIVAHLILAPILYIVCGNFFFVFMLYFIISSLMSGRHKGFINSIILIIYSVIVPWIFARFFFEITISAAFFNPIIKLNLFDLIEQLILIIIFILFVVFARKSRYEKNKRIKSEKTRSLLTAFTMIIVLTFFWMTNYDKEKEITLRFKSLYDSKQWTEILDLYNKYPLSDYITTNYINQALYHKGNLLDKLFSYPQNIWRDRGMTLSGPDIIDMYIIHSDVYYNLGFINEAEHWAYEDFNQKQTSKNIKRLFRCSLIKGNNTLAWKYLSILECSPVDKTWTRKFLKKGEVVGDKEIEELKACIVDTSFFTLNTIPEDDLKMLLSANPKNKMAFEFLLANYLLRGKIKEIIPHIRSLQEMGYDKIPKHIEEIMILLHEKFKINLNDLGIGDYTISKETKEQFKLYNKIAADYRGNKKAAKKELYKNLGNTFWYYATYLNESVIPKTIEQSNKAYDDVK